MATATARAAPRKRTRKRKRRAVSESSSSSSSSESEEEVLHKPSKPALPPPVVPQPETSSSSESSSASSSDSESDPEPTISVAPAATAWQSTAATKGPIRRTSPSPSPPPAEIPTFINAADPIEKESQEQLMKAKFRKFWMTSVVDGFKDDLEQIRKEPNLGTSRLSLLIDSLASGADIFTTSSRPNKSNNIDEIEVILE